jgi:hypothetical protein
MFVLVRLAHLAENDDRIILVDGVPLFCPVQSNITSGIDGELYRKGGIQVNCVAQHMFLLVVSRDKMQKSVNFVDLLRLDKLSNIRSRDALESQAL